MTYKSNPHGDKDPVYQLLYQIAYVVQGVPAGLDRLEVENQVPWRLEDESPWTE